MRRVNKDETMDCDAEGRELTSCFEGDDPSDGPAYARTD